jgi:hypothetical protein
VPRRTDGEAAGGRIRRGLGLAEAIRMWFGSLSECPAPSCCRTCSVACSGRDLSISAVTSLSRSAQPGSFAFRLQMNDAGEKDLLRHSIALDRSSPGERSAQPVLGASCLMLAIG